MIHADVAEWTDISSRAMQRHTFMKQLDRRAKEQVNTGNVYNIAPGDNHFGCCVITFSSDESTGVHSQENDTLNTLRQEH